MKQLKKILKKLKKTLAFRKICAIISLACEGNKETNKTSRENEISAISSVGRAPDS